MRKLSGILTGLLLMASALISHSAWAQCNGESWTPDSRYQISSGDEVLDTQTKLIWKRCAEGTSWDSNTCTGKPSDISWNDAMISYPVDGQNWRLPNIDELTTLRSGTVFTNDDLNESARTGCWGPAINTKIFPGRQDVHFFWSGSSFANDLNYVWYVESWNGYTFYDKQRSEKGYVRLVRGEQWLGPLAKSGKAVVATQLKQQLIAVQEKEAKQRAEAQAKEYAKEQAEVRAAQAKELALKKKFEGVLKSGNPQQMYLAAVKYENDNEKSQAKSVYLVIMDRFSSSPVAMKAADRLASLKDVEAIQSSNFARQRASEDAANAARGARDAAISSAQQNRDISYQRCQEQHNACYNSCNRYSGSAYAKCTSTCVSCSR